MKFDERRRQSSSTKAKSRRACITSIAVLLITLFVNVASPVVAGTMIQDEVEFEIIAGWFGSGRAKVKCTNQINAILKDNEETTTISTPGLRLKNPRGYFRDELRIYYKAKGQEATLVLKNNAKVNLRQAILDHIATLTKPAEGEDVEIVLPGEYTTVRAGMSGQILIFHLAEENKLVLVDVVQQKIIKEIPVRGDIAFAANQTKLLIGIPQFSQLQRWDLATLKRDGIATLDRTRPPRIAVMGCAGNGPLALQGQGQVELWDVDSMERIRIEQPVLPSSGQFGYEMSVSADGKTFVGWITGLSGQEFHVLRIDDNSRVTKTKTNPHSMNGRWAYPGADGGILFRYGGGAYRYDMTPYPMSSNSKKYYIPTDDPRYSMYIDIIEQRKSLQPTICSGADLLPIYTLKPFKNVHSSTILSESRMAGDLRFRYLPQHNLVTALPASRDRVLVREFDLAAALKAKDESYLFVNSKPAPTFKGDETFRYQLSALSSSQVKYSLDSGPEGMTVSADGEVNWTPTEADRMKIANVIIAASNADNDLSVQAFELFPEDTPRSAVASSMPSRPTDSANQLWRANSNAGPIVASLANDETMLELPSKFSSVRVGGAGRYLIFHMPERDSLVIVDVPSQKLQKEIAVPDEIVFAANRTKLLIAFLNDARLERWDLESGTKEKSAELDSENLPKLAAMGSAGEGPLALMGVGSVQLWDVSSLELLPERGGRLNANPHYGSRASVSADGQTFCSWVHGISSQKFFAMKIHERSTSLIESPDGHSRNGRWVIPTADGAKLFRYAGELYSRDFEVQPMSPESGVVVVPTSDPRFILKVRPQGKASSEVSICTSTDLNTLVTLKDIQGVLPATTVMYDGNFCELRTQYIPESNVFAYLPATNDRVVFRKLNLEDELQKSQDDLLVVTSNPPTSVTIGDSYTYQIEALTNHKGTLEYTLAEKPERMTIDKQGRINWKPDTRPRSGNCEVVVDVAADDHHVTHRFTIDVKRNLEQLYAAQVRSASSSNGFVRLDDLRLEMPEAVTCMKPGKNGRTLVLCGNRLAVLSNDGWTVESTSEFDQPYLSIGERDDYYVAIANDPNGIFIIDKKTSKVTHGFRLTGRITDLALHPTLPISYVAAERNGDLPHNKFVVFDETNGEGRENDEWVGEWLAVSNDGDFLIAGYSDLYRNGSELLLNPTRWHVVPTYGSLNWLIRYDLNRTGDPEFEEIKENVGGGGRGIVLSDDAERVAYLSNSGYPSGSRNLAAWDPNDFSKLPVPYEIKGIGDTKMLAFHPTLPLVATARDGKIILLDRESGESSEETLPEDIEEVSDVRQLQVSFSPDGKNVIIDGNINGIHYLHKFPLKLDADQQRLLSLRKDNKDSSSPANKGNSDRKVRLVELESLRGGANEEMTTAMIAKNHSRSVVIVASGDSSGSGFVIGRKGYVLTCAHCIDDEDDIDVTYAAANQERVQVSANIVAIDDETDLALLQVIEPAELSPVLFGIGRPVERGDNISVIGNPLVGDQVLDHTMTEGIISSPAREFDGQRFLQITAAVNPGSSGGPLFNHQGKVIGMVDLKARIDGAAFAIPADMICRFLMRNLDEDPESFAIERDWYFADGDGPFVATYSGFSRGRINMIRVSDGKYHSYPKERMSLADQAFVELLSESTSEPKER